MDNPKVLCGASYYEQKFYLNPLYGNLPKAVQEELKVMCVLFVDDVGGIVLIQFDDEGKINITGTAKDGDIYYDEIGSRLKIKEMWTEHGELLGQLEEYYDAINS